MVVSRHSAIPNITGDPWSHDRIAVGDVSLHYVEAGSGRPVVFLHGFPEFWYSWRHQLVALADAGLRALAVDLRGYNESDKPTGIASYRLDLLSGDVAAFIRTVAGGRAAVVAHDWGGVIAYHVAMRYPELIDRLIIINAPHPAIFRRELYRPRQMLRSWYIFFFQLPWLPERMLARRNYAFLRRSFPAFAEQDLDRYRQALAKPGALTAALNYYRAALRYPSENARNPSIITVPTLVIWGERDRYLGPRLSQGLERWIENVQVERFADFGHWIQMEAPDAVNRLLVEFLRE